MKLPNNLNIRSNNYSNNTNTLRQLPTAKEEEAVNSQKWWLLRALFKVQLSHFWVPNSRSAKNSTGWSTRRHPPQQHENSCRSTSYRSHYNRSSKWPRFLCEIRPHFCQTPAITMKLTTYSIKIKISTLESSHRSPRLRRPALVRGSASDPNRSLEVSYTLRRCTQRRISIAIAVPARRPSSNSKRR